MLLLALGCTPETEPLEPPLAGGETTLADTTYTAFENPAPNLSDEAFDQHLDGDVQFEATFVSAPATINPGLGPFYNSRACNLCHLRDGGGLPVVGDSLAGTQLVVRVAQGGEEPVPWWGVAPVPGLGLQVQDHAIYGQEAPATVHLEPVYQDVTFPADGATEILRRWDVSVVLQDGSELGFDLQISPRLPPPVFGLGLLEAISPATLEAMADPDDADGDGISGRVNHVWSEEAGSYVVGRFGWKASQPTLLQQAGVDYLLSMGVTNPLYPEGGEPEIDDVVLEDSAFYTATLAVPMRRNWDDEQVLAGEELFFDIGCESCHTSTLVTGDHEIAAVSNQTIHPYTDLLLHNMGMGLADSRESFEATGTEWRTPPLWGIGLTSRVLGDAAYLHDGRAETLEAAILWHGGEAELSKEAFREFSATDRAALIAFLESL
ncbi:MAG: thiol oxidoreductase [Proteobacteria bacterium]|nr:thiol oxidoreductase [Pseudomonadota bacterium]MCP4916554.1 thiol oxidoreductase [Pseudomonadota bacterium]